MPDFSFESQFGPQVAGVDEAGRGPLAGPVVAAAVVLNAKDIPNGLNDSKKLSPARRETLFAQLHDCAQIGVGIAAVEEIDSINILQATYRAMERAVAALPLPPRHCLVDGNRLPKLKIPAQAVVKGDTLSLSIAAASIIAKVTRDRLMHNLHATFPHYDWAQNMGYGTPQHLNAIRTHGPCPHHRLSFAPFKTEFPSYQR